MVVAHIRRDLGLGEDVAAVYDSDRTRGWHRTLNRRRSEVLSDMPAARAVAAPAAALGRRLDGEWRPADPGHGGGTMAASARAIQSRYCREVQPRCWTKSRYCSGDPRVHKVSTT